MKIVSICVGQPRDVQWHGPRGLETVSTSIFKDPIAGPVRVGFTNIEGDRQADLSVHGGTDKAVYAYSQDAYAGWVAALKVGSEELPPGSFGENLTVTRLDERDTCLGDRFEIGSGAHPRCVLEVSEPRMPCFKLGIKFGDMAMVQRFLNYQDPAGGFPRPGVYFRVIQEGMIGTGDTLTRVYAPQPRVSIVEIYAFFKSPKSLTRARAREIIDSADALSLSARLRRKIQAAAG